MMPNSGTSGLQAREDVRLDERIERMQSARDAITVRADTEVLADIIDELLVILHERRDDDIAAAR